jgi:hypothetical protein
MTKYLHNSENHRTFAATQTKSCFSRIVLSIFLCSLVCTISQDIKAVESHSDARTFYESRSWSSCEAIAFLLSNLQNFEPMTKSEKTCTPVNNSTRQATPRRATSAEIPSIYSYWFQGKTPDDTALTASKEDMAQVVVQACILRAIIFGRFSPDTIEVEFFDNIINKTAMLYQDLCELEAANLECPVLEMKGGAL